MNENNYKEDNQFGMNDNNRDMDRDFDDNFMSDDECPAIKNIYRFLFLPKPFGMLWSFKNMEDFLKHRGYRIIERVDEDGNSIDVAVKRGDSYIPDATRTNIVDLFEEELQLVLLKWLKTLD